MMHEVELWVLVDENGDYVVRKESDELADAYSEEIEGGAELCRRVVKVVVRVPVESYVTMTGDAPAEGDPSLTVTA